jgi:hypothetical protein
VDLYRIRMEAPDGSGHFREVSVGAENDKLARAIALRSELELVEYSILTPEPAPPVEPDGDDAESLILYVEAHENYAQKAAAYPDALEKSKVLFEQISKTHHLDKKTGKIVGPSARGRAKLFAHLKAEPYEIVSCEVDEIDVDRLVHAVMAVQGNPAKWDRMLAQLKKAGVPLNVIGTLFGLQMQKQLDGSAPIVWSSATMKVALTTNAGWTPNQDTHDFFDDVTQLTGTGYTAGGATLGSKTSNYNTTTDVAWLDAADTSWTTATIANARRAPIYSDTGGAASTDPLWGYVDFEADVSVTAGTLQITWDATGIITVDVT